MRCTCRIDTKSFDPFKIPLDCPLAWELISSGNTKGIFQIESHLCKKWAKNLKPDNMELLSALIAIIRPGVLKATDDSGNSLCEVFVKRRHGEVCNVIHQLIEDILQPTYQIPIYQESIMQIAQKLCGFNLKEADQLRKAIGKKDAELMSKTRQLFMDKAKERGLITTQEASTIFDIIEKSNRYLFNKSHSISYAYIGYMCAYIKSHFPLQFYTAWIRFCHNDPYPQEELKELVTNARYDGIFINPPDVRDRMPYPYIKNEEVYLGLTNIKGIGEKALNKLPQIPTKWWDILRLADEIKFSTLRAFVQAGALFFTGLSRTRMLAEIDAWELVIKTERTRGRALESNSLIDFLTRYGKPSKEGGICSNHNRVDAVNYVLKSLKKPGSSYVDTPVVSARYEQELLGVSITASKSQDINVPIVTETCHSLKNGGRGILGIELIDIKIVKVKNGVNKGKEMAFGKIEDSTGSLDMVIFPNVYELCYPLLIRGNTLLTKGYMKGESFILSEIWQA